MGVDRKDLLLKRLCDSVTTCESAFFFVSFRDDLQKLVVGSNPYSISPHATMPVASSPGSDAFYRRSMRKGTGGDAEGEAMRANLNFQNTLREGGGSTPDDNTLSAKRSRRAKAKQNARVHTHVSIPTETEVDALLTRLANGSPVILHRTGVTPPKPAWSHPKPADTNSMSGTFQGWLPTEALGNPGRSSKTPSRKTPERQKRAIQFTTPGEQTARDTLDSSLTQEPVPNLKERLPIFERLYRQVPSGQRQKFGFPIASGEDSVGHVGQTNRSVLTPTGGRYFPKDLAEKRREIYFLKAELAAREVAERAGAADAAALVAAEMARRGGLLPDRAVSRSIPATSATPTHQSTLSDAPEDATLAQQEAAARDALERILQSPGGFGSPSSPGTGQQRTSKSPYSSQMKPSAKVDYELDSVDWRCSDRAFAFSSTGKKPWRERLRTAESNRNERAAQWESQVKERANAKSEAKKLVAAAESELKRLRKLRSEIVTRQTHQNAIGHGQVNSTQHPYKKRGPWGFESTQGTVENIRNIPLGDANSPSGKSLRRETIPAHGGDVSPLRDYANVVSPTKGTTPGRESEKTQEASPLIKSRTQQGSYGATESFVEQTRVDPNFTARGDAVTTAANPAAAARAAAARVRQRERETAKTAAQKAKLAKQKTEAERSSSKRAAERAVKSLVDTNSASFLKTTVASVGKARVVSQEKTNTTNTATPRARVRPPSTRRNTTPVRPTATLNTPTKNPSRVDKLELEVLEIKNSVTAQGTLVQTELEGLRAQMAAMLEMMAHANATNAKAFTAVMHSVPVTVTSPPPAGKQFPVKSELHPTPPRNSTRSPPRRIDAKTSPQGSPKRQPVARTGGSSQSASPREIPVPAERPADIPRKSNNPFLSG